jgi:hypothetical protein
MTPAADPNFPSNLDIHPLHLAGTACAGANGESDAHGQTSAIAKYGIAGRVWEASAGLLAYLTPGGRGVPACSLFSDPDAPGSSSSCPARILELGSGQALASLHLAARLPPRDTVVLTDLPNVIPLCNQSVDVWSTAGEGKEGAHARVVVQPLAWGEDAAHLSEFGPFTHVLMCDLVRIRRRRIVSPGRGCGCVRARWTLADATHRSTFLTSTPRSCGLCSKSPSRPHRSTRIKMYSAPRSFSLVSRHTVANGSL